MVKISLRCCCCCCENAAVSVTICSSHLTSFLSTACILALSHSLHVTQSPDYTMLSLSPFSFFVPRCQQRSEESQGSAGCIIFCSSVNVVAHSHKRDSQTCGDALQSRRTHSRLKQKMWIICQPSSAVRQTKGQHMHACLHTFAHVYSCVWELTCINIQCSGAELHWRDEALLG